MVRVGVTNSLSRFLSGAFAALVSMIVVGGCGVDLQEGVYQCDLDGPRGCPPGWVCSLRPEDQVPRCYREPQHLCGNGVLEITESCDGTDFGEQTCATAAPGLGQGRLACNEDCTLDTSGCHQCGNGTVEGPETCDGSELAGGTCWSVADLSDGQLGCNADCTYDTSGCNECGNGTIEGREECDGQALGGATCETVGDDGGFLGCSSDCTFDRTSCFRCGDGSCDVELGEESVQCSADCGWALVAAGGHHTCGVLGDGSVWCWGANDSGQLGNGDQANSASPVRVIALDVAAVDIAAGRSHTCAVLEDGSVWCWGANDSGQVSPDAGSGTATPLHVELSEQAAQVVAGDDFTCIRIVGTGVVQCWGGNAHGQLGNGQTTDSSIPVAVPLGTPAIDIGAGSSHVCTVLNDGSVWCWGNNGDGQVAGDGQPVHSSPVQVPSLSGAQFVAPGDRHSCALLATGEVWCWGNNSGGELGDGTDDATNVPVMVSAPAQASALASGTSFSCAVFSDHHVWCWGSGADGRLGAGTASLTGSATPLQVLEVDDAQLVTTGLGHACSVHGVGFMHCWGKNDTGQLGDGSLTDSATPVSVLDSRYWH